MAEDLVITCALADSIAVSTQNLNMPCAPAAVIAGTEAAFESRHQRAETQSHFEDRRQHEYE